MKESFVLLPLTQSHLAEVAEIERLCFSEPWSEKALELLLGELGVGVVCIRNGSVVAYGGMMLAPDEGQITNIAVRPSCRRQGLGRAVTEALVQLAQTRKLEQIALEVRASNEAAISLYRGLGFEKVGRRKNFYRQPTEDALVMIKKIGKEWEGVLPL